jgi:hypothetical protein
MDREQALAIKRRDLSMWLDSFFESYRTVMAKTGYAKSLSNAEKKRGEIKKMIHDWTPQTKVEQKKLFDDQGPLSPHNRRER